MGSRRSHQSFGPTSLAEKAFAFVDSFLHKTPDTNLPTPASHVAAARPDQSSIIRHPTERDYFSQLAPQSVRDAHLPSFDPGVFNNELLKLKLYSQPDPNDPLRAVEPEGNIVEGTYAGTQLALTQAYSRIEQT